MKIHYVLLDVKIIMPKIEQLEKEYEKIQFVKVNIDKNKRICEDYHVDVIPSMIMLKNGNVIYKITRITDIDEIKVIIANSKK